MILKGQIRMIIFSRTQLAVADFRLPLSQSQAMDLAKSALSTTKQIRKILPTCI